MTLANMFIAIKILVGAAVFEWTLESLYHNQLLHNYNLNNNAI